MKITMSETTANQQNVIMLTGEHPLTGATQLAKREHNRQTGDVRRYTGMGVEHKQFDEKDWPRAVKATVKKWKEKIHDLEVMNAQGDNVGRELFASLTED
jgi:hypothetical protein